MSDGDLIRSLAQAVAEERTLAWALERAVGGSDPVEEAWARIARDASAMTRLLYVLRGRSFLSGPWSQRLHMAVSLMEFQTQVQGRAHGYFRCNISDCSTCVETIRKIYPKMTLDKILKGD